MTFGFTISLMKKIMFTGLPDQPYVEPNTFVSDARPDVVDPFEYLGSILSGDGSLDSEMNLRIEKAGKAVEKLEIYLWADRGIIFKTKLSFYEAYV